MNVMFSGNELTTTVSRVQEVMMTAVVAFSASISISNLTGDEEPGVVPFARNQQAFHKGFRQFPLLEISF